MMHFVIIGIAILVILYLQVKVFSNTNTRLKTYKEIFPESVDGQYKIGNNWVIEGIESAESIQEEIDRLNAELETCGASEVDDLLNRRADLYAHLQRLQSRPQNRVWGKILFSINRYLERNRGSVSDFHLIKDIVDRNCDAEEEAIQTQVPMPLYYGLMGTMAGIIVGVGYLWLSGGLGAILSTEPTATSTATDGIIALLGGVALAMICSIVGIILTTVGSSRLKDAKISVEGRKHEFLSWMQAELLPKLNNDVADVLNRVTANLTQFNETFSENARNLRSVLATVNNATAGQAQILEAINKLKISRIATANIDVYDKLKGCTDEIGMIAEQLRSSREYLEQVRLLNDKLDDSEQRTKAIEDMAIFFKEERANIDATRSVMNQAIGGIQTGLRESIESLKEESTKQITELVAHTTEQRQRLQSAIDEQDEVMAQKTAEISRLVANLSAVEKMVQSLDSSAKKQSQAIATLSQDIRDLATQKASGSITVKREKMPRWAKVLIISGGSIVSAYCLLSLVFWVLNLLHLL